MKKNILFTLFSVIFLLSSCTSEKFNTSPLSSSLSSDGAKNSQNLEKILGGTMKDNLNASEITNLLATFPNFKNENINTEVSKLKVNIQNYLYAFEAYNIPGKNRYFQKIQNSYKKIQSLRKKLTQDEDELMNRYLVKLKTNISELEAQTIHKP